MQKSSTEAGSTASHPWEYILLYHKSSRFASLFSSERKTASAGSKASCKRCPPERKSACIRSRYRANASTSAALDAGISVNYGLAVASRNCAYRALAFASTAHDAIIRNYICHSKYTSVTYSAQGTCPVALLPLL